MWGIFGLAVQSFLDHKLGFTGIAAVNEEVMSRVSVGKADSLEVIYEADHTARKMAEEVICTRTGPGG